MNPKMRTLVRFKMEQSGAIPSDDYTIIERMLYSVRLQVTAFKVVLVLVSKAARIKTVTKSFLDDNRSFIFAVGQTYSANP